MAARRFQWNAKHPTLLLARSRFARRVGQRLPSRLSSTVEFRPLGSVLIANRGEIALRVGRTASQYGIRTTTLYTDPDATSQHALSSLFSVNLGDPTSYLDGDKIIQVAREQGCDSIHPGYGFLSENSEFARKCTEAGLIFIGPSAGAIEAMGNKSRSKEIMSAAGVPCIPGYHGSNQDPAYLQAEAEKIGFPVLVKAVKGGGGKGMRICRSTDDFLPQLESAKTEARNSFGDDGMLVEKYIMTPRHIEVQVFADQHGNCVALGERDCSVQRRHQKIIEESPAPNLAEDVRQDLWEKARAAALAVHYEGAGTVEFIFDNETGEFFFMEMNTRLQVEHPVTEMVTGLDLVHWQFLVAQGQELPLTQEEVAEQISRRGHAFEARIYAENPEMNFIPDSGKLLYQSTPDQTDTVRIDSGFVQGDEVSSFYDPMISKLIVQGPSRRVALAKLRSALEEYKVAGPITNIEFLKRLCVDAPFVAGEVETGYIEKRRDTLFPNERIEPEVWAQAALGIFHDEILTRGIQDNAFPSTGIVGFSPTFQRRAYQLKQFSVGAADPSDVVQVVLEQRSPASFNVTVGDVLFENVTTSLIGEKDTESFFPHTRLNTTVIRDSDKIMLFQQGKQYRLQLANPAWAEKALGIKDAANSVVAPMPCKILRVDVAEGDVVQKDQALVVIESMKMETVIRSPQNGVVSRVVHQKGDMCKAGTALVEFEAIAEDAKDA